jgi:hypothetical protein
MSAPRTTALNGGSSVEASRPYTHRTRNEYSLREQRTPERNRRTVRLTSVNG